MSSETLIVLETVSVMLSQPGSSSALKKVIASEKSFAFVRMRWFVLQWLTERAMLSWSEFRITSERLL